VRASQVTVSADVIAQGRVTGATAGIAPERSSVMGRPQGAVAAPPSRFAGRAVVVRHAPPPPPVSFAARRDALQANPGRPLDPAAAEALRRTQPVRAPQYRQAPAATPAAARPITQPAQPPVSHDPPRDAVSPRNDRPRVQEQPATPRPPPQTTVQPRSEPRSEANQAPKTERKQAKKGDTKKEERKQ